MVAMPGTGSGDAEHVIPALGETYAFPIIEAPANLCSPRERSSGSITPRARQSTPTIDLLAEAGLIEDDGEVDPEGTHYTRYGCNVGRIQNQAAVARFETAVIRCTSGTDRWIKAWHSIRYEY